MFNSTKSHQSSCFTATLQHYQAIVDKTRCVFLIFLQIFWLALALQRRGFIRWIAHNEWMQTGWDWKSLLAETFSEILNSYCISLFQINTRLFVAATKLDIQHNINCASTIICIFSAHLESIILSGRCVKTAARSQRINSLQTLISVAIKLHTITVWCGGMATTGQEARWSRVGGVGEYSESRETSEEKTNYPPVYIVQTKASQQWHQANGKE